MPSRHLPRFACLILVALAIGLSATTELAHADTERYFTQTGFKVKNAAFLDFFDKRGGVRTFGYPTSREFSLQGSRVQFFQRGVMQLRADKTVTTLNLLDPELMPYTQMNGATFPSVSTDLTKRAPLPGSPNYSAAILDFVKANAPNSFESLATGFHLTFLNAVTAKDAYPPDGNGNVGLLPGFDLELWGVPTSAPAYDPNNKNFVYQRFQRGIMHYDKTTGATQGLLLADYLKAIITGQNLPADLDAQARGSRFYRQYDASAANWLARPADLADTDLRMAFEREPIIALDPGHGGNEVGAAFTFPDGSVVREKNVTLVIAKRTAEILQANGYQAILTRSTDRAVNTPPQERTGDKAIDLEDELQARIDAANNANASLYVSIHFNGLNDPKASGTEVYYCATGPVAPQSKILAQSLQKQLVAALQTAGYATLNRGAKPDERAAGTGSHFYVLNPEAFRAGKMPAALGEGLFLTNPVEAAKLKDPAILEAIAQGYAKGIMGYYQ